MRVLVIGAGIIGAAIADALARRGVDVVIFEMRSPGRGATQASAGMLAPYLEAEADSPLLALGLRSLALFDDWIARLRESSGRRIEYARTGSLEVALDESRATHLQQMLAGLARLGARAEWIDGGSLRSAEPAVSSEATGGVLVRDHGLVDASAAVAALVDSARRHGARLEAPIEAAHVAQLGDVVEVRAGDRRDEADAAVIAAGSWSRRVRIANIAALPVRPIRGQLLHLAATTRAPAVSRVVWGAECYTVPWSDGSLLVGATVEDVGFDEHSTAAGVSTLLNAALRLLPSWHGAAVDAIRVGLRPATPDGLPAIGPLARAPRVVVATGHYRNGVLLAPLTAEIVTAHLLDGVQDAMASALAPDRLL